jgi:hypothetical protein
MPGDEAFGVYSEDGEWGAKCPYGKPGDRLWVREAWRALSKYDDWAPVRIPSDADIQCVADYPILPWDSRLRSSLHMPRWASRITLEITDVRVQRLQDITEEDAIAEGAPRCVMDDEGKFYESTKGTHRCGFAGLWAHINGADSWEANPFVWVLSFQRIEKQEEAA